MRRWRTLVADNERWWRNVPKSFGPFFGGFGEDVGEVGVVKTPSAAGERGGAGGFPELRCHLEWHGECVSFFSLWVRGEDGDEG